MNLQTSKRLSKTNSGVTAKYVYDTSGHLLAEASAGSSTTREYIYLGDRLLGEYDVAAKKLYSVHTDRMGTPFLLTDKTKAVQWSGVSEPYGRVASSSGSVVQNVRLPGQYDDGAGLYHNGFRDYSPGSLKDPRVGVYLESDPIRLAGGMNVYRYASANPLTNIDPSGLLDVYTWDFRGSNDRDGWGHTSIRLGNGTYISWWPQPSPNRYPLYSGSPIYYAPAFEDQTYRDDVRMEGRNPDHTIHINGLDEGAIEEWWDDFRQTHVWHSTDQNCSTTVGAALAAGGGDFYATLGGSIHGIVPGRGIWTPNQIGGYADSIRVGIEQWKKILGWYK